jgi:hypothetical protein
MKDDEIYTGSPPRELTMFEFDMLVGAWRNYERGATITAASFPGDIIVHYWQGNYSESSRMRIAQQFVNDHSRNGEADWDHSMPMDASSWVKFYNFCWGCVNGFAMVQAKLFTGLNATALAFRAHIPVDYDGKKQTRWYFVPKYMESPYFTEEIAPENIIDIRDFGGFAPDPEEFKFIKENKETK